MRRATSRFLPQAFLLVLLGGAVGEIQAANFKSVRILDKDYLVVHLSDGDVTHNEGGVGEAVTRYTPELNATAAGQTSSWTLKSSQDGNYGTAGKQPLSCSRKKKLSGHAQMEWIGNDYRYEYTYEHWIYLRLPHSLQQGMTYTLEIASATNSDTASASLTFDIYSSRSEAIHVNLVGYAPDATHKAADLYQWMGDGGARDYSGFVGNAVYVYDVTTGQAQQAGAVSFWRASGADVFGYNLTRSDVWNVDFSDFVEPGTYRLVVEGVGCSQDFRIASNAYADPFKVSVRGYFYMRIGQDPSGITPPPRTPRYIPGVSPANTVVYLTTMHPYHANWGSFSSGDPWDRPNDWAAYRRAGNPTNPNAWGGHSDAADWDRHLGHVSSIYDMLLPYLLTNGAISDDDTGIPESANGIPDILDEAQNEVDFWLRLRDGDGYSHGLTNPNGNNELFQAGPTAIAAWANAANAAMLADAFRVAGQAALMAQYRDAAITAYTHANGLSDPMLDQGQDLGGLVRGRDFKMMAAAFLYNVTGNQAWEAVVNAESVCAGGPAPLNNGSRNQVWASAAYLMTPQTVHYPTLQSNMRAAIIAEARSEESDLIDERPSRRATDRSSLGYFHMAQNVDRTIVAHAVATNPSDQDFFRKALALEADWGLGRNPLNQIHMTTAFTPLASKRSVVEAYTSGSDDGVAGVHPGHTPYFNLDDWAPGMVMGRPSALYENSYPANVPSTWPIAEAFFPSRWVWAHTEFTPQQTMSGKMALYGYLHGLAGAPPPPNPVLTVQKSGAGSGTVTSNPSGIDCGADCNEAYANGTAVTLTATATGGSNFTGWGGACYGTGTCTVSMVLNRSVTASFEPVGLTYTLSVAKSGTGAGTVTSLPAGINCGTDCSEAYLSGTSVALTAAPTSGSTFTGWSGACSGTDATCTVTMSAARSVTATFMSTTAPTVTIYGDGLASGWEDWSWTATVNLAGTSPVRVGTLAANVTLGGWGAFSPHKATGAIDTYGYQALKFWVHGGTGSTKTLRVWTEDAGGASSATVDVTAAANTWTEITVTLAALGNPAAIGRLNFMNFSGSALPMITFDEVRLLPAAPPDLIFKNGFDQGLTYALSVSRSGSGFGSVASSPAGIACGTDCSESYASGTTVTLTPLRATGSTFMGWGGACTGTGPCTVAMSAARSVTASFGGGTTVPGAQRWVGRVDASNPSAVRFAWQGAGFVAAVTGSTVSVNLQTSGTPTVFFQPVVDGLPGTRFEVPQGSVRTVTVASGLPAGTHVIELYRETEGMYGVSTFSGFAQGTVTGAPVASGRVVEVVGDSISAGYGNLGVEPHPNWVANPPCHWTAENSTWFGTYAAVAGRELGADVSTIARSGWGMYRDLSGNTGGVLSSVYENTVGTGDPTPWGFEPDASVVIINLGTNDIAQGDPGTPYETAYFNFVQDVRGKYPQAWIFLTIGSMLGGSELATINTHLANVVAALGDPKVVAFDLGTQNMGANGEIPTGCDWHPNVADHARMAAIIRARLQTHLGW